MNCRNQKLFPSPTSGDTDADTLVSLTPSITGNSLQKGGPDQPTQTTRKHSYQEDLILDCSVNRENEKMTAFAAVLQIQATTLPLRRCELNRLVLVHIGVCSTDIEDTCVDLCTGEFVETADKCSTTHECCWNGVSCILKSIPRFPVVKDDNQQDVAHSEPTMPRRRAKRQARGSVEGSIEHDRYGTTYNGRLNRGVGKNGNAFVGGSFHHPSNAWQLRGGYEHRFQNNGRASISGNRNSYGGYGVNAGYSGRVFGGRLGASAGLQRNPYGRTSPSFQLRFSKRFGK